MSHHEKLIEAMDRSRRQHGYLTLDETMALADRGNVIFDPFSTLICRVAEIGGDNVFHPLTRIGGDGGGKLRIGSANVFHSNTVLDAGANVVTIGDGNQFGEGAVSMKANAPGAAIEVGDNCRFCGTVNVYGKTSLGSGSQILGDITVYDCALAPGQPHSHPVADERGAVLKGCGVAKGISLATGRVVNGWQVFRAEEAVLQSTFHP